MTRLSFVQRIFLTLLVLLASGAELRAQESTVLLSAGEVTRITALDAPGGRVVGRVRMLDGDSLVLDVAGITDRVVIPISSITVAEIQNGKNRGKGALMGAGMGVMSAFALASLCMIACTSGNSEVGFAVVWGIYLVPPVGLALGAVFAPTKWAKLPLPRY